MHGCWKEFNELISYLRIKHPGIEIYHTGDLTDRGSDSGLAVQIAMTSTDGGVTGNHDSQIVEYWDRMQKDGFIAKNPDKARTLTQMNEKRINYLRNLPLIHVFDDLKLVIVHGGLFPKMPLYKQASLKNVCFMQMISTNDLDMVSRGTRWWGDDAAKQGKQGVVESVSREEGFARWYELYDHEYDCIYGHSVMGLEPFVHQNEGAGKTIGIDTGSCFGGFLTAYIYPDMYYVQVPCEEHVIGKNVTAMKKGEFHDKNRRTT